MAEPVQQVSGSTEGPPLYTRLGGRCGILRECLPDGERRGYGQMRMNHPMKGLLDALVDSPPPSLPAELSAVTNKGFVTQGACSFLRVLCEHRGNAIPSMFPDETGYECFINHIHIDTHSNEPLPLAMVFADEVGKAWVSSGSSGSRNSLRVIVSCNDTGCVVRCHVVRPQQSWLDENLEAYQHDAVWVNDYPPTG